MSSFLKKCSKPSLHCLCANFCAFCSVNVAALDDTAHSHNNGYLWFSLIRLRFIFRPLIHALSKKRDKENTAQSINSMRSSYWPAEISFHNRKIGQFDWICVNKELSRFFIVNDRFEDRIFFHQSFWRLKMSPQDPSFNCSSSKMFTFKTIKLPVNSWNTIGMLLKIYDLQLKKSILFYAKCCHSSMKNLHVFKFYRELLVLMKHLRS